MALLLDQSAALPAARTFAPRHRVVVGHALDDRARIVKRVLDVTVAAALLLLTAPVVLVALLAVRLESRGPVLFKQDRVGQGQRHFTMYKIRSMYADADARIHQEYVTRLISGTAAAQDGMFKLTADPRITRVGRWIRRSSIDELPQLWNVLKGDMSLVGPRPATPHEVALYDEVARRRLHVHPGITGAWQVNGRCKLSFAQMIELDLAYARDWSPARDLAILARTPLVAFTGRGAA